MPPIAKPDAGAQGADKAAKRSLAEEARLREQIAEIQRRARLENLTAAEKEVAIQQEIYRLATTFGQAGPETETARLEVEKRILELKREQAAAGKAADEEVKAEQDRTAEAEQRLAIFEQELAIAEKRAAGENEVADAMQRELDIQQLQARLMEDMGVSQEAALALAQRQVDAETAAGASSSGAGRYDADGRRADGRRQIRGYSQAQGGVAEAMARAQSRIDEARAVREIPSGLDAFNAGAPLAETAQLNAAAADKQPGAAARGVEDKLERLIAISEQGLLGD
jgi:hypothetical protein